MSKKSMNKRIEKMLGMSPEEVKEVLPFTLDEIRDYGIGRVLEEVPDLLSKLMAKLVEIGAAKFFSEIPEASDKLMDFLWEAVDVFATKSEGFRSVLEKVRDMTVNLEASDSPLRGHFTISKGKFYGASNLLHFKYQDYKFFGPTPALMGLLGGERAWGSGKPRLQTEGHPGFRPLVTPVIQGISKVIKGKQ